MRRLLPIWLFISCGLPAYTQVVISEVYPVPADGLPEWIELHNTGSRSVDLDNWFIHDAKSSVQITSVTLAPGEYVICGRNVDDVLRAYGLEDRDGLEVSLPTLNNTTDIVRLADKDSTVIDELSYDMRDGTAGVSFERFGEQHATVVYEQLWLPSLNASGATPARLNSQVLVENDRAVSSMSIIADSVVVVITNTGWADIPPTEMAITIGSYEQTTHVPAIQRLQDWRWTMDVREVVQRADSDTIVMCVSVQEDDRTSNNERCLQLGKPPDKQSIVINEILFDPQPGRKDFVELYNVGGTDVDISGWTLADEREGSEIPFGTVLEGNNYIVLSMSNEIRLEMDSGVPVVLRPELNFNSTGDDVILKNQDGVVVDAVRYSDNWHSEVLGETKGISLERRAPELTSQAQSSWTSSGNLTGSTPGAPNAASLAVQLESALTASPSPFSSQRQSPFHPTIISARLPFVSSIVRVSVVSETGFHIRDLLNGSFVGLNLAVAWDGRSDDGLRVPLGPYIALIEAVDVETGATCLDSCVVVVGE